MLTENKEAQGVIVLHATCTSVRLGDPEERRNNESKAGIEQSKGGKDCVCVGIAENELPLCGYEHANACMIRTCSFRKLDSVAYQQRRRSHLQVSVSTWLLSWSIVAYRYCQESRAVPHHKHTNERIRSTQTPPSHQSK